MCWVPTNKENIAVAKVAQKDIPIIKIGIRKGNNFVSAFFKARYCTNVVTPRRFISPGIDGRIEEGYHFYKPNMIKLRQNYSNSYTNVISLFCNINISFYNNDLYYENDTCIAKGYVPRGTIYYLNAHGEGVAEQIVITEFTNVKDYLKN